MRKPGRSDNPVGKRSRRDADEPGGKRSFGVRIPLSTERRAQPRLADESDRLPADHDALVLQLAGLLSNNLSVEAKSHLMAILADRPDARELLLMSYEIYRQQVDSRRQTQLTESGDDPIDASSGSREKV